MWRWPPPTPYGVMEPITSEPSRFALGALPAPEVPEAATITASGSASRAPYAGKRASETAVG
ncbi:hypothetical protein GCM10020254_66300 [Streptomyces goshikiensis]